VEAAGLDMLHPSQGVTYLVLRNLERGQVTAQRIVTLVDGGERFAFVDVGPLRYFARGVGWDVPGRG
jgi:hypothetical protein